MSLMHKPNGDLDPHGAALVAMWVAMMGTAALFLVGIWTGDGRWTTTAFVGGGLTLALGVAAVTTSDSW